MHLLFGPSESRLLSEDTTLRYHEETKFPHGLRKRGSSIIAPDLFAKKILFQFCGPAAFFCFFFFFIFLIVLPRASEGHGRLSAHQWRKSSIYVEQNTLAVLIVLLRRDRDSPKQVQVKHCFYIFRVV